MDFNTHGIMNRNCQLTIALKAKKQIDPNYPVDPNYPTLPYSIYLGEESVKSRALRALRALQSPRALVPKISACPRAIDVGVPSCPRARVPKFSACPRAFHVGMPSCPRARVPKFSACPRAFNVGVPSCPRALVPKFSACPRACVALKRWITSDMNLTIFHLF